MNPTRYEIWEASRDLMQGRRQDSEGRRHGWTSHSWHLDKGAGPPWGGDDADRPRECLNGAIALAEAQLSGGQFPWEYQRVNTLAGAEVKHVLASVIRKEYGAPPLTSMMMPADGPRVPDETVIMWFNDVMGRNQDLMNHVLDLADARLFAMWLADEGLDWEGLVEESEHLDKVLPLVG